MATRHAVLYDVVEIAKIYNRVVREPAAVIDPRVYAEAEVREWLTGEIPCIAVVERDKILGFAHALPRRTWGTESKTAEMRIFIDPDHRKKGLAKQAIVEIVATGRSKGYWKYVAYMLDKNAAGRALLRSVGWREVGTLEKHVQLPSGRHDVVIAERLLMASRLSKPEL